MGLPHEKLADLSPGLHSARKFDESDKWKIDFFVGLRLVMLFMSIVLADRHHSCDALPIPIDAALLTLLVIERA